MTLRPVQPIHGHGRNGFGHAVELHERHAKTMFESGGLLVGHVLGEHADAEPIVTFRVCWRMCEDHPDWCGEQTSNRGLMFGGLRAEPRRAELRYEGDRCSGYQCG